MEKYLIGTPQEVETWRRNFKDITYKKHIDRIYKKANEFVLDPIADHYAPFPTLASSPITSTTNTTSLLNEPRTQGINMLSSAFVFLMTGERKYLDAVVRGLLKQAQEDLTDFSDPLRWPTERVKSLRDTNPVFIIAQWIVRLLKSYDYVKEYIGINDRIVIDMFFQNAFHYLHIMSENDINALWKDREAGVLNDPAKALADGKELYVGGPKLTGVQGWYNNRRLDIKRAIGFGGIFYNNEEWKEDARRFYRETVKYTFLPDGTNSEMQRWELNFPNKGWQYAAFQVTLLGDIADIFARSGDTSLYNYYINGVDLKKGILTLLYHLTDKIERYAVKIDPSYRIDGVDNIDGKNWAASFDTWFSQQNLFYNDRDINMIYNRAFPSTKPHSSLPAKAGEVDYWHGQGGIYVDKEFMFLNREGKLNPYAIIPEPAPEVLRLKAGKYLIEVV
jgi:hypothetical protein